MISRNAHPTTLLTIDNSMAIFVANAIKIDKKKEGWDKGVTASIILNCHESRARWLRGGRLLIPIGTASTVRLGQLTMTDFCPRSHCFLSSAANALIFIITCRKSLLLILTSELLHCVGAALSGPLAFKIQPIIT